MNAPEHLRACGHAHPGLAHPLAPPATRFARATAYGECALARVIAAPLEQVFAAWVDAQRFVDWWRPSTGQVVECALDARPGGQLVARGSDAGGQPLHLEACFHEVESPDWLVFAARHLHAGERWLDALTTVTFHEQAGGTRLALHAELRGRHDMGIEQAWRALWWPSLLRLDALLAGVHTTAPPGERTPHN